MDGQIGVTKAWIVADQAAQVVSLPIRAQTQQLSNSNAAPLSASVA